MLWVFVRDCFHLNDNKLNGQRQPYIILSNKRVTLSKSHRKEKIMVLYHIGINPNPGGTFIPRVPFSRGQWENGEIRRICFSDSMKDCCIRSIHFFRIKNTRGSYRSWPELSSPDIFPTAAPVPKGTLVDTRADG